MRDLDARTDVSHKVSAIEINGQMPIGAICAPRKCRLLPGGLQKMRTGFIKAGLAVADLTAFATAYPAVADAPKGQLYSLHSGPNGGCPGLDWHVTVMADGKLSGMVAWDGMTHMAKLDGARKADGSFEMAAVEVGGAGKKATVTGSAAGDYINLSISGTGGPCDGKMLAIPRVVGGLSGGGG